MPSSDGIYPRANSNELSNLEPENTFERKVALLKSVTSDTDVFSA